MEAFLGEKENRVVMELLDMHCIWEESCPIRELRTGWQSKWNLFGEKEKKEVA